MIDGRRWYPLFLDIEGKLAVVVGGGEVGQRKCESLLAAGARVRVVSPELTPRLEELRGEGRVEILSRRFSEETLDGAVLAFAATADREVNDAVRIAAEKRGIPVNLADDPEGSDFFVPAVLERGALRIAVSTGGASPALSRRVRERIDAALGPEIEWLAQVLGEVRESAARSVPLEEDRKRLYETILDSDAADLHRVDPAAARARIDEIVRKATGG